MEREGMPELAPVRTSSGPMKRLVGFDTSPSCVVRWGGRSEEEDGTPSPAGQLSKTVSPLARALSQTNLQALPRLTINTKRGAAGAGGLKKSKSMGCLRSSQAQPIPAAPARTPPTPPTQPSSPASHDSQGSSGPVRIPHEAARRVRISPDADHPRSGCRPDEFISTPMLSAASSTASHHRAASGGAGVGTSSGSPAPQLRGIMRRSFSTKDLFEAQADAVTAQAQVQGLHLALKREHEEVLRLREQLALMAEERDRLLQEVHELRELRGHHPVASTPRVFDMDDPHPLRAPFGRLRVG